MILFLKHIDIEGPGTLGEYCREAGFTVRSVDLFKGESLPEDLSDIKAVVVLGGPMNVYEEDKHGFLNDENIFIQEAADQKIPLLGLCLGSQLLAKACWAQVGKSPVQEIGWRKVSLTDVGTEDPIFENIGDKQLTVFQWHEDMFDVPQGGLLLAAGDQCKNQAFKIGEYAYGFQFHIEIKEADIVVWSEAYLDKKDPRSVEKRNEMVKEYRQVKVKFDEQARTVYRNFLRMASSRDVCC